MHPRLLLAVPLLFSATLVSADPFGCHNTEPRRAVAPSTGVTRLIIIGRAGSLRVTGHAGGGDVVATGTACSSDKDYLKDIQLTAHRSGSDLQIEAVIPGQTFSLGWTDSRLDFEVSLPDSLSLVVRDSSGETTVNTVGALEVEDGSGELTIRGVKGNLKVKDGSGGLTIADVTGDVAVDDGSGSMEIERVAGNVTIHDGSGSIDVRNVQKNVIVADDGSGGVDVRDVKGNFTVQHKGSGAVSYERVAGKVSIPHRR